MIETINASQNYTAVGDISAMALCIVFLILLNSAYTIKQKNYTIFRSADIVLFIGAACNLIYNHLLSNNSQGKLDYLILLFRIAAHILLAIAYFFFVTYIENLVSLKRGRRKFINLLMGIIFIVFAFLEIVGWKIGITPGADDIATFEQYYFSPFTVLQVVYAFIMLVILIKNHVRLVRGMFRALMFCLSTSFMVILVQNFFQRTSFTAITFTLPIVAVLFLFHYNAYDVDTGMFDPRSFETYISSLEKSRYGMIFLYIDYMKGKNYESLKELFYHFNEDYFKGATCFKVRDKEMVMVFKYSANPNPEKTMAELLQGFSKLYYRFRTNYKIVIFYDTDRLNTADSYINANEYISGNMEMNSIHVCNDDDLDRYDRLGYIREQLLDIGQRRNYRDPRVEVYAQPILDKKKNGFSSAEVLMRLQLPKIGLVNPNEFLGLAEKYDLMHLLTMILLTKACDYMSEAMKSGFLLDKISINIFKSEMLATDFVEDFVGIVKESGVGTGHIAIDISSGSRGKGIDEVADIIKKLSEAGFMFYFDDLSSSLSKLEELNELPFSLVKFDRQFVKMLENSDTTKRIVFSLVEYFKENGYEIVFVGIENDMEEELCLEMEAGYLQGYKYSRPMPIAQLSEYLEPGV